MAAPKLTPERLREVLHYDPLTGLFTRRTSRDRRPVGTVRGNGYLRVNLDGSFYYAHRLAWFYMHGEWPTQDIDHKDGCRLNNRIDNLRDVSRSVNMQNVRAAPKRNRSGLMGVWRNGIGFCSFISVNHKRIYLGQFYTQDEAHAAYIAAKRKYHPGNML